MILGIGTDLILVKRIEKLILNFEKKFLQKIFSDYEVYLGNNIKNSAKRSLFYAKRFAAKEAFAKALGLGIGRGINFCDIEVENDNLGKPRIKVLNDKIEFLRSHFGCQNFSIHLSLTDEKDLALAFVIIEKIS